MIKGVSKVAFNTLLTTHLILCKGVFSCSDNYSFQAVRLHQSCLTLYLAKLGEQRQYRKERGFTSSTLANYAVENNNDKKKKHTANSTQDVWLVC